MHRYIYVDTTQQLNKGGLRYSKDALKVAKQNYLNTTIKLF